jgi:hypothetical protein
VICLVRDHTFKSEKRLNEKQVILSHSSFCIRFLGKHGNLKATPSGASKYKYKDFQVQFSDPAKTIVGRSVVIHNNGARIACANLVDPATAGSNEDVDANNSPTTTTESTDAARVQTTNAAPNRWVAWDSVAVVAGFVGLLNLF